MNKSAFFKYLADGGGVSMITWHGEPVLSNSRCSGVRYADKVQSNAIRFNDGSWLYKDDVKAADVKPVHAGGTRPAVSVGWAVYQLVDSTNGETL